MSCSFLILLLVSIVNIDCFKQNLLKQSQLDNKLYTSSSIEPEPEIFNSRRTKNRKANPSSGEFSFPQWEKAFKSQPKEFEYALAKDDIEGIIPKNLKGNLYRNMPALFEKGGVRLGHYLDGDGYVTSLKLDGKTNTAKFISKFVKTDEYLREKEEDKILYRSTFRTQRESYSYLTGGLIDPNNFMDLKLKNLANTNVVSFGNKLFALYEAGIPIELDLDTLETNGPSNLNAPEVKSGLALAIPDLKKILPNLHDNLIGGSYFTAHPKIDLNTNKLIGFSYRAEVDGTSGDRVTTVRVREWDDNMIPSEPIIHPLTSSTGGAPHDFSVTNNYYCFIENRLEGDINQYILGIKTPAQCLGLDADAPMILNLVPRLGSNKKTLKIPLGSGFTIHSPCAFENELGQVELYTTAWDAEAVACGAAKGGLLGNWEGTAPNFDDIPLTLLYKTIVDTESGKLLSHAPVEGLEQVVVEHPHIDPRLETQQVRYIYMSLGSITGKSSPPVGYQRLDLKTGKTQRWFAPKDTFCEELVVVPKDDNINGYDGDDVWLLAAMFDSVENRSMIAILDGDDIEKGPVARCWLQHSLPHSLHGMYLNQN